MLVICSILSARLFAALAAPAILPATIGHDVCLTGKVQASYLSQPIAAPENTKRMLCVTNGKHGFYVLTPTNMAHEVGDVVVITGELRPVDYLGVSAVIPKRISSLRHEPPDRPVCVSLREIRDGAAVFRTISTKGLIIDAFRDELDPRWNWLLVSNNETTVPLAVRGEDTTQATLDALIGQNVSVSGLCAPSTGRRRFASPIVRVNGLRDIRPLSGDSSDVFSFPLLTSSTTVRNLNRYCLRGFVLATWDKHRLFVQPDEGMAIEVDLRAGTGIPRVGELIDVSGFAQTDIFNVRLTQAVWRSRPTDKEFHPTCTDVEPKDLIVSTTGNQRLETDFQGKLIRIKGVTADAPKDLLRNPVVHLNCDGHIIPLNLSALRDASRLLVPGTTIAATGVCQLELDTASLASAFPRVRGFCLILRGPDDIEILRTAPWWTTVKLLLVIGILILLLVAIVLWNFTLRRIAERRGRALFRENVAHISSDLRTDERTRLAVDLHDSLAQMLTGVSLQIDAGNLEIASKSLKSCRDELRNCLWDLRNQTLEERDMGEAIRRTLKPHIGAAQLLIRFNVPRAKLSDSTAHSVLMIVRELATNAVRHGHAKTIRVAGGLDADELKFSVRDDGCGFDPDRCLGMAEGHFGLQGIRERVKRCGGTTTIESVPGKGTRVTTSLKRQK